MYGIFRFLKTHNMRFENFNFAVYGIRLLCDVVVYCCVRVIRKYRIDFIGFSQNA